MVATTFSLSASTSSAGKLFGRGPRGSRLETAMPRRLAAADLVIALCLGHGAPGSRSAGRVGARVRLPWPALDMLTLTDIDGNDRSIARRAHSRDPLGRDQEPCGMLLAGAAMRGDKERHGKNGKRDEPGDQRIGFGQCERNLTPDPEALMVDRFLAKQPGGHRMPRGLSPQPRDPNRSGCAARLLLAGSADKLFAPPGGTSGRLGGLRSAAAYSLPDRASP